MNNHTYIIYVILLLVIAGCEEPQQASDSPPVEITLYARYLEDESRLKGEASMKMQGADRRSPFIPFTEGISFQGKPMREIDAPTGIQYVSERNIPLPDQVSFRFIDLGGNEQFIEMPIKPIKNTRLASGSLSRAANEATLLWEGPPLKKGESCVILISEASGKTQALEVEGTGQENELSIPISELEPWQPGSGTMYVVRKGSFDETAGSNSINLSYEYYSKSSRVTLSF